MDGKADLRRRGVAARDALPPGEREERSRAIVDHIVAWEGFRRAGTVLLYRHVRGEVSLDALAAHPVSRGKRFAYPLCVSRTEMKAYLPRGEDAWAPGPFGILEPVPARSEWVAPEEIDLVLCPCAAFDAAGNRIGMGGGYYDRYLPRCERAVIAAVAFEAQRVEAVPAEGWDRPMEFVFTEGGAYPSPGRE